MNVLLWVLQAVLALLSVAGGAFQMFKLDQLRPEVAAMRELPAFLWVSLGAVGCLAGLGLILPGVLGRWPQVVPAAALVVAVESALISGFYLYFGDRAPLPYSLVMVVLALGIAFGRYGRWAV